MIPRHRAALAALALTLVPYVAALVAFPASGDQDAALHANQARFRSDLLSPWGRPLFAVLYVVPAMAGYAAVRVFTVLVCGAAGWLAYLAARKLETPRPWIAIPFTVLQPCLFVVGHDAMTEPLFAAMLAGAVLLLLHDRERTAALVLSLLPLVRPEGFVVLAVAGVWWLARRRAAVLLLPLGLVLWELACLVATGNPRYILDTWPWPAEGVYRQRGAPWHYLVRWPLILGPVLVPWVLGLRSWRPLRLPLACLAAVFAVHTLLFATGSFSSLGFERYFATFAAVNALVAASARLPRWAVGVLLSLAALHAVVRVGASYHSYYPAATREFLRVAPRADRTICADNFGYVFLDVERPPRLDVDALPRGTVVVWDDLTGKWWHGLSAEDFQARGFRVLRDRTVPLGPFRRPLRQTILIRD